MVKKITVPVVSTLITLLLCELLIRGFMPQISEHDSMFIADSHLGWKFVPNTEGLIVYPGGIQQNVKTNPSGFRDAPFPLGNDSLKKIMVLGDSFVSNISVGEDEVFTEIMEERLEDTSVLNLGVNGYGQVQELLLLEKSLPVMQPDLVLVLVYLRNDFRDNLGNIDWLYPRPRASISESNEVTLIPISSEKSVSSRAERKWYHKLHLYHFLSQRTRNIKKKVEEKDTPENSLFLPPEFYLCKQPFSKETEEMYVLLEQLMFKIARKAEESEVPIVFALAPSMVQVEDTLWQRVVLDEVDNDYAYQRTLPNDVLEKFGKENQLSTINLFSALHEAHKKGLQVYHPYEQHWTPQGNEVVAKELLKYLKEIGWK